MKRTLLFLSFLVAIALGTSSVAQTKIQYSYDASGNRIGRVVITTRAFSPLSEDENAEGESWEKKLSKENVHIYPNPVQTDLTVSLSELPEPGTGLLQLYDMQGKLLLEETIRTTQTVIPMADFPRAVYIMKLIFGEMQSTWKIIKE